MARAQVLFAYMHFWESEISLPEPPFLETLFLLYRLVFEMIYTLPRQGDARGNLADPRRLPAHLEVVLGAAFPPALCLAGFSAALHEGGIKGGGKKPELPPKSTPAKRGGIGIHPGNVILVLSSPTLGDFQWHLRTSRSTEEGSSLQLFWTLSGAPNPACCVHQVNR